MKYSIIIPAYNEEKRIAATVRDYANYVKSNMPVNETEIIIVVNGSLDRTDEIARDMENHYDFISAWCSPERMGKGGAVLKGFSLAKGGILAFADADNATTAPELRKLIESVENNADAAIGSRWLPGSEQTIPQPFMRRVASRVFNLIVRCMFQLPFKDTQCGAKAFKRDAIETVRSEVRSVGWAFDVELIWHLVRYGFEVKEVPIVWSDNSSSRLRMHRDAPSMLIEMLKLRFGKKNKS